MNPSDEQKVAEWGSAIENVITIEALLGTDEASKRLAGFCHQLSRLAPKLQVMHEKKKDAEPGLSIAPNIIYRAVPENRELDLFLKSLDNTLSAAGSVIKPPDPAKVALIDSPVQLDVFISSHCPFCPHVVSALLLLAKTAPPVHVNIIDGTLFRTAAEANNIKAVPTVILNNDFRWSGQVDMNEILDVAVSGADADFGVDTLKAIVEAGNAETVAKMMLDKDVLYSAFIDLLVDEKWSVRLGAMVVFEYLNESSVALAGQVVEALWERFDNVDDSVRGDILHLYGESGRQDALEKVRTVLKGDYAEEIQEAAREALE
ncbi:MAG: thioredoxin family protein [Thermodesulfobacteriota bacterium]|nr:thioredoxin family protein [Thermodesulfobacteriota bacterium]